PARIQLLRALEPEVGVGVGDPVGHAERRQRRALLLDPRVAALGAELVEQPRAQREQVQHVVEGIGLLLRRQGPPRPAVLLPRLDRLHAEVLPEQSVEAQRLAPRKRAATPVSKSETTVNPYRRLR